LNRLAVVGLLALLVTGGIAAVYRGPVPPLHVDDANAALKAARSKSHVMFDPANYSGAPGSSQPQTGFLAKFKPDLGYYRGRFLPEGKARTDSNFEPQTWGHSSAADESGSSDAGAAPQTSPATDPYFALVAENRGGKSVNMSLDAHFQLAGALVDQAGSLLNRGGSGQLKTALLAASSETSGTVPADDVPADPEGATYTAGLSKVPSFLLGNAASPLSYRTARIVAQSLTPYFAASGPATLLATVPADFLAENLLPTLSDPPGIPPQTDGISQTQIPPPSARATAFSAKTIALLDETPDPVPEPGTFSLVVLGIFAAVYFRSPRA
jgi:hypothetical protein